MLVQTGYGPGFVTLEADTEVQYQVSAPYRAELDRAIRYDDPAIGIDWPDVGVPLTLSDKDREAHLLSEIAA
jgi:dTDP-4-dehydrorhamnose 3,5-epimerase